MTIVTNDSVIFYENIGRKENKTNYFTRFASVSGFILVSQISTIRTMSVDGL